MDPSIASHTSADDEAPRESAHRPSIGKSSITFERTFLMATNVPKLTYSVPEVCEALQISRTTLWKLVRSRRLKPVRIGRRVLFSLKAVEEFLNGSSSAHRSR